jgi:hypothetical protein
LIKLISGLRAMLGKPPRPTTDTGGADASEGLLVNAYATRGTLPPITFPHSLHARRDRSDPELAPHLAGFLGYIQAQATNGEMTKARYHLMRHVQRVRHQLSFSIDPSQLDAYAQWAAEANAVAFLPDGTVRDHHGRLLLAPAGGATDPEAEVPWPRDAWARKARTEQAMAERGLDVPKHLPPVLGDDEMRPRDADEIHGRAQALVVVSERAISLRDGDPLPVDLLRQRLPQAFEHLSPDEQAFLALDEPRTEQIARFGWQCECTHVLAWVLGLLDTLPFPSTICNGGEVTHAILASAERTAPRLRMRSPAEVLDQLDLHVRLHWLTTEARLGRRAAIAGVEPGVVLERHRVLNWLVRFEDAAWDDIDMPT